MLWVIDFENRAVMAHKHKCVARLVRREIHHNRPASRIYALLHVIFKFGTSVVWVNEGFSAGGRQESIRNRGKGDEVALREGEFSQFFNRWI